MVYAGRISAMNITIPHVYIYIYTYKKDYKKVLKSDKYTTLDDGGRIDTSILCYTHIDIERA